MAKWSKGECPWERQQGESSPAFQAFSTYLDMGEKRSIRAVSQQLGKSKTLIDRWSRNNGWVERVRAYENDLRKKEFAEAQKAMQKMHKRQIDTAMLLQKKAVEALAKLDPEHIPPKDIIRFISEGTKIEKQTRAEALGGGPGEAGGGQSSFADTIIAAYKRRMESDDNE